MSAMSEWLVLAPLLVALSAAAGAAMARAMFAMVLYVFVAGAAVAAFVTLRGALDAGLNLALIGAGWAPVALLSGVLLTSRVASNTRSRRAPWLSLIAALCVFVALAAPLAGMHPGQHEHAPIAPVALGFWLAPLLLAGVIACAALLGYGERGALDPKEHHK